MLFLGLNLALDPYSFALGDEKQVLGAVSKKSSFEFTENIITEMGTFAESLSLSLASLTAIAVVVGPGGYTGLRVGVSVAKSIAQLYQLPVYPLSTLEVLVTPFAYCEQVMFSVIPARKNELNVALFSGSKEGLKRLTPDYSCSVDVLEEKISMFEAPVFVVGIVPEALKENFSNYSRVTLISQTIDGDTLVKLAKRMHSCRQKGDYKNVFPVYSHDPFMGPTKT